MTKFTDQLQDVKRVTLRHGVSCASTLSLLFTIVSGNVQAVETEVNLFELPLAELAKIKVISASRSEDSRFNAPIAISSINQADIQRSNVSTIAEALRLIPGVIVKEESRGNFDVYIRGLDSVPPGNAPIFSTNSSTLVMVDYQPVYNWFYGGIYWPSLGISLLDIERIEVVRGPASAMYGPNAANGVIHIITKSAEGDGWTANATVSSGGDMGHQVQARSEYGGEKFQLAFHAHSQQFDRSVSDYYSFQAGRMMAIEEIYFLGGENRLLDVFVDAYPDISNALNEKGFGFKGSYQWNDKIYSSMTYRNHESEFHDNIIENAGTPLSYIFYQGENISFSQKLGDFSFNFSQEKNTQDLAGSPVLDFESTVRHWRLEYEHKFENLNVHALLGESSAKIDSLALLGSNNLKSLSNQSMALHLDYLAFEKLRLTAAYRAEDLSTGQNREYSYQLGAAYTLNSQNQFWFISGEAFRNPFILDSFTHLETVPIGNVVARFSGNDSLALLRVDENQLGWRFQFDEKFSTELEYFYRQVKNFSTFVATTPYIENQFTVYPSDWINVPTMADQDGLTFSVSWQALRNLSLKVHATRQDTDLEQRQMLAGISQPFDENYKGGPEWFGGLNFYWRLSSSFQLSLESYYLDESYPEYGYGFTVSGTSPVNVSQHIASKLLIDFGLNYHFNRKLSFKLTMKNIADQSHNEFLYADSTPRHAFLMARFSF